MRRRLVLVLAWAAATAVAVGGSWVGLQPVVAAATPELPTRLSASQLRDAAPRPSPSGSPTPSPTPEEPSPEPAPEPSPSPSPEPSPMPLLPELPASSDWERIDDTETFERTFVLVGGDVVVRANERRVVVESHTANPDFHASVTRQSRTSMIFAFKSVEHTSQVWIIWRNGPYAEVTETV